MTSLENPLFSWGATPFSAELTGNLLLPGIFINRPVFMGQMNNPGDVGFTGVSLRALLARDELVTRF